MYNGDENQLFDLKINLNDIEDFIPNPINRGKYYETKFKIAEFPEKWRRGFNNYDKTNFFGIDSKNTKCEVIVNGVSTIATLEIKGIFVCLKDENRDKCYEDLINNSPDDLMNFKLDLEPEELLFLGEPSELFLKKLKQKT